MGSGNSKKKKVVNVSSRSNSLIITSRTFIKKVTQPLQNVYKIGKTLGNGSFGEVRIVTHIETGIQRAVKIFRKSAFANQKLQEQLYLEINILKSLDHPNIIRFIEYFEDDKKIYLILEKCEGGELYSQIIKINSFSEELSASLMKQILSAVNYMHERKIVHRDLKPENILFEYKSDFSSIKIIDFGLALHTTEKKLKEKVGSIYYVSPEVLNHNYTDKCDMWSCGVLAYIMLSGVPPFDGDTNSEIASKIKKGEFNFSNPIWKIHSKESMDFIQRLLCPENIRMSAVEALNHPWITNIEIPSPCKEIFMPVLQSLRQFHCNNKLKEAVFVYVVSQCVTLQETKQLKNVFLSMDKNGDGKIGKDELEVYYRKIMGMEHPEEDVKEIMKQVDSDESGFIDYSEFIKACLSYKLINDTKILKMAFKKFDLKGNGKFSLSEIRSILQDETVHNEETWSSILSEIETNLDGSIDYKQFSKLLKSN